MTYALVTIENKRYLSLPEFLLDADDVGAWMVSARDDEPDLYAELVHIYLLLKKPSPACGDVLLRKHGV